MQNKGRCIELTLTVDYESLASVGSKTHSISRIPTTMIDGAWVELVKQGVVLLPFGYKSLEFLPGLSTRTMIASYGLAFQTAYCAIALTLADLMISLRLGWVRREEVGREVD